MSDRREFLKAAGAALTTSIFTGNVRGANDRIRVAFIGPGRMGQDSMSTALKLPNVEVPVVCDVYQPNLEKAIALSGRGADGKPDARPEGKRRHRLSRGSGGQVHRRRKHLHARPLARLHDGRGLQERQGRLRREADLRGHRRGPQDGAGGAQV